MAQVPKPHFEYEYIDMRYNYDAALLKKFYDELMVPTFGIFEDELEDIEIWQEQLEKQDKAVFNLHVLIVFEKGDKDRKIIGGSACEYYPQSNSGLLTYFAVRPEWQRRGVGRFLVTNVLASVDKDAKSHGKKGCDAVFLETNDAEKVSAEKDVMDPKIRHKILIQLGFSILNFNYVQPALSPDQGKCSDLLFCVHNSFLRLDSKDPSVTGLDPAPLAAFVREFFIVLMGEGVLATDPDYNNMVKELASKTTVTVRKQ